MVTTDEITKLVHKYVEASKDALRTFCPEFYYINLVTKVDFSTRRRSHRGGMYAKGPGISMAGSCFTQAYSYYKIDGGYSKFEEYPSFKRDPIIGSAFVNNLEQLIALNTGHEVAHACQWYLIFQDKLYANKENGHGEFFQKIYQKIRLVLNKELPDQLEAQRSYNDFLKSIKKRELYVTV